MYWTFIVNPTAGTGYAKKTMEHLESLLRSKGEEYRILLTERAGHATELAAAAAEDKEAKAVVAVGGDGTVSEVAAGLRETGKAMGIIPAGTGNDFIKSVGIPNDPDKALDILFSGKPKSTDTGTVNDRFFLNVCGTGFDVTVLDYAEKEKLRHRGLTPYLLGLIKAIAHYKSTQLHLTIDGSETVEGKYLICSIANGIYIGGGIPICPNADPSDGKLELVQISHCPRWKIPFYLPGLMMKRDLKFRITKHQKVSKVLIKGEGLRFNIDGDIKGMDQAEFRIRPDTLLLIRP